MVARKLKFQSTRPLRGATNTDKRERLVTDISIHAPLTGRDLAITINCFDGVEISIHAPLTGRDETFPFALYVDMDFNPRAPYGARPQTAFQTPAYRYFNPRAPYGARLSGLAVCIPLVVFQSTRPLRGATTAKRDAAGCVMWISIHAPLTGRDCQLQHGR